jgi:hypothetical protein
MPKEMGARILDWVEKQNNDWVNERLRRVDQMLAIYDRMVIAHKLMECHSDQRTD